MKENFVRVEPVALFPTPSGCAVFLGDGKKEILFYIDPSIGASIQAVLNDDQPPRPLSHDFFGQTLKALGGKVTRMVIVNVEDEVFFAQLRIEAENETMAKKVIEIDCRPSDAIAMTIRFGAPMYVLKEVWENLRDMSETLQELAQQEGFEDLQDPRSES